MNRDGGLERTHTNGTAEGIGRERRRSNEQENSIGQEEVKVEGKDGNGSKAQCSNSDAKSTESPSKSPDASSSKSSEPPASSKSSEPPASSKSSEPTPPSSASQRSSPLKWMVSLTEKTRLVDGVGLGDEGRREEFQRLVRR